MKIEFFQTEYGLDQEAVNGGVYKVELINSHKNKCACLYVGESVYMIKRCGEHLYEFFKDSTYFGLNENDLANSDFILKFSVAESISEEMDKAMYKTLEKKYIAECKPLTQGNKSDRQIEHKEKVVQDFLVEQGFKKKESNLGGSMEKLFLIGNGFDLGHGLKTSYEDFENYLENTYSNERKLFVSEFSDNNGNTNLKGVVSLLNALISCAKETIKEKCEKSGEKKSYGKT